jgi:hypothetical protein
MNYRYLFSALLLSLLIVSSCSTESTPVYQLSISVSPTEAGSVNPSAGEYDAGEVVEVTALPNEHWVFSSWSGDQSGNTNPVTITMSSDREISAIFVVRDYPLTIEIVGEGGVMERVIQVKTTDYQYGTKVELTANPAEGWIFKEWQGDLDGSENQKLLTINSETSVIAIFERITYKINLNVEGNGTISIEPEKDTYFEGDNLTITVNPEEGLNFSYWEGDFEGMSNPVEIILEGNITATAFLENSPFQKGNGTKSNPFQINNIDELQEIKNYKNAHFIQVNNIDATISMNWNEGEGFQPIGSTNMWSSDDHDPFTGSYNGSGYSIDNLYINIQNGDQHYPSGLFGAIDEAEIKDLKIKNISITHIGASGLIGDARNSEVKNIYMTGGNIEGGWAGTGGLIGRVSHNVYIENCHVDLNVNSIDFGPAGGLVGQMGGRSITLSSSSGSVNNPTGYAGGLIGSINSSSVVISKSSSSSDVTGGNLLGGFIGYNMMSTITQSYSTGDVILSDGSSSGYIGGFIGGNEYGVISDSYSLSTMNASSSNGGGFIGVEVISNWVVNTNISNSFSVGEISGDGIIGGFHGYLRGTIENGYWGKGSDITYSAVGKSESAVTGIVTLKLDEMRGTSAQDNMPEFDWVNIWKTTSSYPILRWQKE